MQKFHGRRISGLAYRRVLYDSLGAYEKQYDKLLKFDLFTINQSISSATHNSILDFDPFNCITDTGTKESIYSV